MLSDVCIIGSDCAALREVLKENEFGLLFKNDDVDSLFSLLKGIYSNQYDWRSISSKSSAYVQQNFDSSNYARHIYESILNFSDN
jgi:glycosyltransferase involved in cell wall biosynthesis